jgi:hypothetical protein
MVKLDRFGESPVYVATYDVFDGEHSKGTIFRGAKLFFCSANGGEVQGVHLMYAECASPTNGGEYLLFDDLMDAQKFAERVGLVEVTS